MDTSPSATSCRVRTGPAKPALGVPGALDLDRRGGPATEADHRGEPRLHGERLFGIAEVLAPSAVAAGAFAFLIAPRSVSIVVGNAVGRIVGVLPPRRSFRCRSADRRHRRGRKDPGWRFRRSRMRSGSHRCRRLRRRPDPRTGWRIGGLRSRHRTPIRGRSDPALPARFRQPWGPHPTA